MAAYRATFELISEVLGADRAIASVSRDDCRKLVDIIRFVPSNFRKRFPGLTAVQAAAKARQLKLSPVQPATVNACLNRLGAVMNYAVNEGDISRSPAKGLRVADTVRHRDKRRPFSTDQLQRIFNAPLFRGCVDDGRGYASVGPQRPRRGRFWVPLIALFTGMRLNEICQLYSTDVQQLDGVWVILVRVDSDSGQPQKRLKTTSSERIIPVHPRLIEFGFLAHAGSCLAAGRMRLFEELACSRSGYFSDPFSKWFARFLRSVAAAAPRTCFHSFRHNFRDALRAAGVGHEIGLALGGWSEGKPASEAAYGGGPTIQHLADAICRIDYPDLDLRHLVVASD